MENKDILIEKFINRELTDTEKVAFETLLQEDEDFAQSVASDIALRERGNREWQTTEVAHLKTRYKYLVVRRRVRYAIGTAATLLLLGGVTWFFFQSRQTKIEQPINKTGEYVIISMDSSSSNEIYRTELYNPQGDLIDSIKSPLIGKDNSTSIVTKENSTQTVKKPSSSKSKANQPTAPPSVSTPILLTQTDNSQPSPLPGNEGAAGRTFSKELTTWSNKLQISFSESIADLQNAGQNANYADLLIVGKQVEALRVLKEQTTFTPAEHFYLGSLILFYEVPTHTNTMTAIEHLKAAEGYREVLETRYIILAFLRLNKVSEAQKVHRANSDVALPNEILILLK